jgi:hypothetical protein
MWICPKCGNENDENFRFCWSCGLTRPEIKAEPEVKIPVKAPKIETPKPPEPPKREIVQNIPEPRKPLKLDDEDDVLPMFARVSGVEHKISQRDEDVSLERKIFTIAVRLLGLFLLYQFLIGFPDLAVMIYSALFSDTADNSAAILFTSAFVIPAAKLLFYLIVGIYLIASGRILLWLLPGR